MPPAVEALLSSQPCLEKKIPPFQADFGAGFWPRGKTLVQCLHPTLTSSSSWRHSAPTPVLPPPVRGCWAPLPRAAGAQTPSLGGLQLWFLKETAKKNLVSANKSLSWGINPTFLAGTPPMPPKLWKPSRMVKFCRGGKLSVLLLHPQPPSPALAAPSRGSQGWPMARVAWAAPRTHPGRIGTQREAAWAVGSGHQKHYQHGNV